MNRKVFIRLIVIAGGIGIIFLSLFAFQLGLDNDPGWGPRRIQLILLGLGIILFGSLYWIAPHTVGRAFSVTSSENKNNIEPQARPTNHKINSALLILSACFVLWLYIWIITIGRIDHWPSGRDYYWKLTQAFQHGQTYLLEAPNPELAKLENPYDHLQRKNMEYLWDTTYYHGKYFLYWGPAPAALGVIVNALTAKPVTDTGLVFAFVIGIACFSALLLFEIYKKFQLPAWAFWGGVFASTINVPLIWLLTRPTFYEVSISGGQFFLMAGFYFLFLGLRDSQISKGWVAASALTFGLAGATRINLLPSIIVLAFASAWKIYSTHNKKFRKALPAWMSLFLPLGWVAVALCGYNYARFGSIFEFGHRYQLTGPSLTANYADTLSLNYILPNAFTYFLRLPTLSAEFPFFTVGWIKPNMWPDFIHLPEHYYYTEPVAGILFIVPLIGLALALVARLGWLWLNGDFSFKAARFSPANPFGWFTFLLSIYAFLQTLILLVFISSAMRYLVDLSPVLIILATIFVGRYVQTVDRHPRLAQMIAVLWVCASVLTVLAGFLIGFTGDKNNFLNQNPALYYQLFEWFKF
ncbi:MAG: hypothetical protein IT310_04915 [Anaerolineales bacterium]|nr:hypothetical protein [Anaerolineales bacterium]